MKTSKKIKVGICIAYDWEMIKIALPLFYNDVDSICLALDINRQTWTGNKFIFDEHAFYEYVKSVDLQGKIIVYEDDFYIDKNHPMKNEVYQRNKIAEKLVKDDSWFIQLDVDEYFLDFNSIVTFLRNHSFSKDVNICLPFITLFKKIDNNYLVIKGETEWMPFITNNPKYEYGRMNGYFNYRFNSPVLHQSWARESSEIKQKVSNWGHKNDFNVNQFFNKWYILNENNYSSWRNFHPIKCEIWQELILIPGNSISELISQNKQKFKLLRTYSNFDILVNNSRIISKLKQIFNIQ